MPSTKLFGPKLQGRSRITNGKQLLPDVDGRSIWARRLRDIIAAHTSDLGGRDNLTAAEASLIRRAAALTVELEHLEALFHANGQATPQQLDLYGRGVNTLRRVFESLSNQRAERGARPTLDATARIINSVRERHAVP